MCRNIAELRTPCLGMQSKWAWRNGGYCIAMVLAVDTQGHFETQLKKEQ